MGTPMYKCLLMELSIYIYIFIELDIDKFPTPHVPTSFVNNKPLFKSSATLQDDNDYVAKM